MYFTWKEFPVLPPQAVQASDTPVIIVGGGPVGLATALGLARYGVRSVVLESRKTISTGSRALAMNRRSMQILDQLGVGKATAMMGLPWSNGWTFYRRSLVHEMNIASPKNEKHGQTNLQQCWIEQLLLDELERTGLCEVRYQHEVTDLRSDEDEATLSVKTPHGSYEARAAYVVAADGPRGISRRCMGVNYEGTSYTQRFVINDIISKHALPPGRRLYFSPPYLPGKAVLMHTAPFGMWRLDFQLLDDQDAEEEMQPEKVHQRIRAHLELMGVEPEYELVLTSMYKANALSLPTYKVGRVLFVGDAAHQVPIFGGRGVNHGYEDAYNLAWKLAFVVKGLSDATLLDSYTPERRGAILDTLADLTKTTLFITSPSPGLALVREAVLSLSESEKFLANLFDPYASPPYELRDSMLNVTEGQEQGFGPQCRPGALVPDAVITNEGQRLYDRLGGKLTVLRFLDEVAAQASPDGKLQQTLSEAGLPVEVLTLSLQSEVARLFGAHACATYLIRPDNRVVGRWTNPSTDVLRAALSHATRALDTRSLAHH